MQSGIFQDQIRFMSSNQFALDINGLTQLREQFQRCWDFMRQNPLTRAGVASTSGQSTSPQVKQEGFSAAASKNSLRVEDLKPPPVKHRRQTSGVSPSAAPSPSTPQTTAGSPPQAGATPSSSRPPAKKRAGATKKEPASSPAGMPAASPAATLAALRSDLIKDSPSPMGIIIPHQAPLPPEEPPSLKRKREEEEIDRDPNAFLEKTLRSLEPSAPSALDFLVTGANSLASNSAFTAADVDPAIPPVVVDGSLAPLSFTVLSSSADPLSSSLAASSHIDAPSEAPFDFDFYIDSSAAGFDTPDHMDAPTPDLIGGGGSTSAPTPATPADALTATPKNPPASLAKSPRKSPTVTAIAEPEEAAFDDAFYSAGGTIVDDLDKWLAGGSGAAGGSGGTLGKDSLATFSWETPGDAAADAPFGSWSLYSQF